MIGPDPTLLLTAVLSGSAIGLVLGAVGYAAWIERPWRRHRLPASARVATDPVDAVWHPGTAAPLLDVGFAWDERAMQPNGSGGEPPSSQAARR